MPDIAEQLSSILQNPDAQKNIMSLLGSLSQSSAPTQNEPPPFDLSSLFQQNAPAPSPEPAIDMATLMKIQQIFSKMTCDDCNVALLRSLKPFLHDPRKADEAIRILQLLSVLPALKECGIFGGG